MRHDLQRPDRQAGARRRRTVAACALALCACSRSDPASERALSELEELAFVPAGRVPVGAFLPLVLYECPVPLLVERFETTRGRWRQFAAQEPQALASEMIAEVRSWGREQDSWPATWMTLPEAEHFALWRGMRLLTPGEWLYVALGPERRKYPWGNEGQDSIANTLELGLGRPCPAGTFEGGRTPLSIYDLLGNVAEWVSGDVLESSLEGRGGVLAGSPRSERSALGGSYRTWLRPIYRPARVGEPPESAYLAYNLHPLTRQDDVGLRCAVPAQDYLLRSAGLWGRDARTRARLEAVGRVWGRSAIPLLSELALREGAASGLRTLLEGARR